MHPQLQMIAREFEQAQQRLERLATRLPDELWPVRAHPERWSVSECIAHLNLTGSAFLPAVRNALREARSLDRPAPRRYRRDPLGWLLWRTMGPPVRLRVRTAAAFVPTDAATPAELRSAFDRLQAEQIECVREADGLPLQLVRIASPFEARVRYNLFAALTILPRHQHRHLWQAEQVAATQPAGGARGQAGAPSISAE